MLFRFLFAGLLPALAIAQSSASSAPATVPTSTSSVPPCALTCTLQNAGSSACGGISNITCLCTNTAFQQAVLGCYQSTCNGGDLQAAETYGSALCQQNGTPINISGSSSASASSLPASSSAAISSAASSALSSASKAASSSAAPSSSSRASSSSAPSASASNSGSDKVTFALHKSGVVTALAGVFLGAVLLF